MKFARIELPGKPRVRFNSRHEFWYVSRYSTSESLNEFAWRWCRDTNLATLEARN